MPRTRDVNAAGERVTAIDLNADVGEGLIAWDWLAAQAAAGEESFVRHLRFEKPLVVKMNGRRTQGLIYKPGMGT